MGDPEAFLVLNADIIGDYPLIDFVEFHRKHSGEHSILATEARRIIFLYFWLLNNAWWHAWFLNITQQGVHFSVIVRVEVDCQLVTCWLTMVFRGTVLLSYPYFIANVEGDKPILTTLVLKYNFSGAYTNM